MILLIKLKIFNYLLYVVKNKNYILKIICNGYYNVCFEKLWLNVIIESNEI